MVQRTYGMVLVGVIAGVMGGVAASFITGTPSIAQPSDVVVRAQQFQLIDAQGRTRARLGFSSMRNRTSSSPMRTITAAYGSAWLGKPVWPCVTRMGELCWFSVWTIREILHSSSAIAIAIYAHSSQNASEHAQPLEDLEPPCAPNCGGNTVRPAPRNGFRHVFSLQQIRRSITLEAIAVCGAGHGCGCRLAILPETHLLHRENLQVAELGEGPSKGTHAVLRSSCSSASASPVGEPPALAEDDFTKNARPPRKCFLTPSSSFNSVDGDRNRRDIIRIDILPNAMIPARLPTSHIQKQQDRLLMESLFTRHSSDQRDATPVSIMGWKLLLRHHYPIEARFWTA